MNCKNVLTTLGGFGVGMAGGYYLGIVSCYGEQCTVNCLRNQLALLTPSPVLILS